MNKFPTLVTFRSAIQLRDAGIRYAYLKVGLFIGMTIALLAGCVALFALARAEYAGFVWIALVTAFGGVAVAYSCARKAEFPHLPRLTLDELEAMQQDMGLPSAVIRQTQDCVLHGSKEEHLAAEEAQALLRKAGRRAH